jgi:hypothetical protein
LVGPHSSGGTNRSEPSYRYGTWLGAPALKELIATALTMRQCMLNPNRNGTVDEAEVESVLRGSLGVDKTFPRRGDRS